MRVDYLGHACFLVTGDSGLKLAFDPYDPECFSGALGFAAPDVSADLVFISHDHADHGARDQVSGSPKAVDSAGKGEHRGVSWNGVATFHDDSGGSARGSNLVFAATVDGLNFCHLGDLGHALTAAQAGELGRVDVLFAPVGGHFTIDAAGAAEVVGLIAPKVVVPMHFKTPKVGFPIAPVDDFLKDSSWPVERKGSSVEFTAGQLPAATTVWVLEPAR
jgi:L-ascorbate metabolism protein UlaG (beta-lactamase superfamily)